jgi:hypothetical protein
MQNSKTACMHQWWMAGIGAIHGQCISLALMVEGQAGDSFIWGMTRLVPPPGLQMSDKIQARWVAVLLPRPLDRCSNRETYFPAMTKQRPVACQYRVSLG